MERYNIHFCDGIKKRQGRSERTCSDVLHKDMNNLECGGGGGGRGKMKKRRKKKGGKPRMMWMEVIKK